MSSINFATKEIAVKIVFYGPGLCGKTTTLQSIYQAIKPEKRPQMVSLATDVDRTIFFDFLPVNAYKIADFVVRLQLYTVPGQVFYNSTRKLVLNGVDGVVMVFDSQQAAFEDNRESMQNLNENLRELGMTIGRVPIVLQYNKRDLPSVMNVEELNAAFNPQQVPFFLTSAISGDGVQEVLRTISKLVITDLTSKGVGRKILQKNDTSADWGDARTAGPTTTTSTPAAEPAPRPIPSIASTFAQAVVPAPPPSATAARAPVVSLTFSPLWPSTALRTRCREVELAIGKGDFRDAVISAYSLCVEATDDTETSEDIVPDSDRSKDPALEMLLRGVSGSKFVRFRELVQRARKGGSITLADALFALHIAVELVV